MRSHKNTCKRLQPKITTNSLSDIAFSKLSKHFKITFLIRNSRRLLLASLLTYKPQPHKMVKYTRTIPRKQPTNCLNLFDHFVGMSLKELMKYSLRVAGKKLQR